MVSTCLAIIICLLVRTSHGIQQARHLRTRTEDLCDAALKNIILGGNAASCSTVLASCTNTCRGGSAYILKVRRAAPAVQVGQEGNKWKTLALRLGVEAGKPPTSQQKEDALSLLRRECCDEAKYDADKLKRWFSSDSDRAREKVKPLWDAYLKEIGHIAEVR